VTASREPVPAPDIPESVWLMIDEWPRLDGESREFVREILHDIVRAGRKTTLNLPDPRICCGQVLRLEDPA
jgi:hypothetical protein